MTTTIQQGSDFAREIAEPLLISQREHDRYNSVLNNAIERIEKAMASNPELQKAGTQWGNRLRKQIVTNNSYVHHARESSPSFSLTLCVGMRDLRGLKYLLRVGEDPNILENGRTPLHLAAARGDRAMVEVLLQCPQLDTTAPNFRNKTALQLAKDPEIRAALLKA